jgi:hypothetical protein
VDFGPTHSQNRPARWHFPPNLKKKHLLSMH